MTQQQWIQTETRSTDKKHLRLAASSMLGGFEMQDEWTEVAMYEHGIMVRLRNGNWYTSVENHDYEGSYESVQGKLWNWARHEMCPAH